MRTPVWPLKDGMPAYDALGRRKLTQIGVRAHMPLDEAQAAAERGDVQLLVGRRPEHLRRDVVAAPAAQAPEDLDSVPDEDDEPDIEFTPRKKAPVRKKTAARKKTVAKKTYGRRDLKAE